MALLILLLKLTHVAVCFILILIVLLQTGRGADLAGAFGMAGSQTAFGPRGTSSLLTKLTTWAAVTFMVTSLTLYIMQSRTQGSAIQEPATTGAPAEAGEGFSIGDQVIEEETSETADTPYPLTQP
ncbi:MAG: preprotein translocase subunit SecG [Acidobacteriota bacterium]